MIGLISHLYMFATCISIRIDSHSGDIHFFRSADNAARNLTTIGN